ncbi:transmembrane protein 51b [Pungitius pungitius]|uniref:transmembrane protein 51b n=1 Tax=Pungitius pungitius TaxID=134920 RepID=UPI002E1348DF
MCSSPSLCANTSRPRRPSGSESAGSGAHYALCALGVGLIALGIVMIVWTVIPVDGEDSGASPSSPGNSTAGSDSDAGNGKDRSKPSTVAMVLVGVGVATLLLSIILCVRSRKRRSAATSQPGATANAVLNHVAREPEEEAADRTSYTVPSYEEVVTSGAYPIRQSNLRNSTSQLPSYEDIIAAVESEGTRPAGGPSEVTPLSGPAAALRADRPGLAGNPSLLTRSASRASRLLRPLRVRRIKSDKLHLKDFRIQIRSPTQNPVTIEPITPPPVYDNKMPELE